MAAPEQVRRSRKVPPAGASAPDPLRRLGRAVRTACPAAELQDRTRTRRPTAVAFVDARMVRCGLSTSGFMVAIGALIASVPAILRSKPKGWSVIENSSGSLPFVPTTRKWSRRTKLTRPKLPHTLFLEINEGIPVSTVLDAVKDKMKATAQSADANPEKLRKMSKSIAFLKDVQTALHLGRVEKHLTVLLGCSKPETPEACHLSFGADFLRLVSLNISS
ncbi:hypothetical protein VPH35_035737 [Triticum aestivum]|uniref:Uncharacterized protein n=1 Tax=Aegilops tauschii TaxID=37682 RepID=N1QRF3_AEGTA